MTKRRSYVCAGCKGEVAIPKGRRNLSLDQVRDNHEHTCPSRGVKR